MKKFTKDLMIGISVDVICNGIPFVIFINNKNYTMVTIIIISAILCIVGTIAILTLYEKLRRFSSAVIDETNALFELYDRIVEKPENQDLKQDYLKILDTLKAFRPYNKDELNDLYIFDMKNAHKPESIRTFNERIEKFKNLKIKK